MTGSSQRLPGKSQIVAPIVPFYMIVFNGKTGHDLQMAKAEVEGVLIMLANLVGVCALFIDGITTKSGNAESGRDCRAQ
jgi:hypothetical protein